MITIQNVTKSFPGLLNPVLNDINFTLAPKDFCVLIGANGSGKSTLLKLISGEHIADSGNITLEGRVAQVVQNVNIGTVPEMTLLENIALSNIHGPRFLFYNRYKSYVIKRLKELNIGLEQYIEHPLKMLSGGQKQMVATLMAINVNNPILLLDEHTSALDPNMQHLLMEYTTQQAEHLKLTTLMITHKIDDAIKYGNRLIMLHEGQIVLDIQGREKQTLRPQDLLALFHQYEDQTLLAGDTHDK